jgi:hypothetical protein
VIRFIKQMKKQDIILLTALLVALTLIRVFFQIPNFNPLGAIALMGGVLFSSKILRWVVPMGALLLGDILLGLSSPMYMDYMLSLDFLFVYASFAAIILLGTFLSKNASLSKVLGGSIVAAVAFFLISNAGSWITMPQYTKDFAGLMTSYELALPFFRATLVSQIVFSLSIYLAYNLATSRKVAIA